MDEWMIGSIAAFLSLGLVVAFGTLLVFLVTRLFGEES